MPKKGRVNQMTREEIEKALELYQMPLLTCPVCGREFRPTQEWVYRVSIDGDEYLVCRYNCMRKVQKGYATESRPAFNRGEMTNPVQIAQAMRDQGYTQLEISLELEKSLYWVVKHTHPPRQPREDASGLRSNREQPSGKGENNGTDAE